MPSHVPVEILLQLIAALALFAVVPGSILSSTLLDNYGYFHILLRLPTFVVLVGQYWTWRSLRLDGQNWRRRRLVWGLDRECQAKLKKRKVVSQSGFQELGVAFPHSRAPPASFALPYTPQGGVDYLDLYVADDLALLAGSRCIAGLRLSEDLT